MISENAYNSLPARITSWKGHNTAVDAVKILTEKNQN